MENYISLFVATLESLKLLTPKEAEKLNNELKNSTIPATYKEARLIVKEILDRTIAK